MPVLDQDFWTKRIGWRNPCHYDEPWLDRYADHVRKVGLRRVWPRGVQRVLDVGCGDGQLGQWLAQQFAVQVTGVDPFPWPGVEQRLTFIPGDAEALTTLNLRDIDLAVLVTVLPFVEDWWGVVAQLRAIAPQVLVLDNLQTPAPSWQQSLSYKHVLTYPAVVAQFARCGYRVQRAVAVNVLDRRLFFRLPGLLAYGLTLPLDVVLGRLVPVQQGRYMAVLFEAV